MGPPTEGSDTPKAAAPADAKNKRPQICHSQKRRSCQVESNQIARERLRELVSSSVVEEAPRVERPKAAPVVAFDREMLAKIAAEAKVNAPPPVEEEIVAEHDKKGKKNKKTKKEKKVCDSDDEPVQSLEARAAAAAVLAKAKELAEAQEKARAAAVASAPVSLAFKPLRGGLGTSFAIKKKTTTAEAAQSDANKPSSQVGPRGGPNAIGPSYGIKKKDSEVSAKTPDQSGPRGGAYATGPTYGLKKKSVDAASSGEGVVVESASKPCSDDSSSSLMQLKPDSSKSNSAGLLHLTRPAFGFSSPTRAVPTLTEQDDKKSSGESRIKRDASRSRDREGRQQKEGHRSDNSSDGERKKRRRKSRSRKRR